MKKILAFTGSNNPNSINEKLISAALKTIPSDQIERIVLSEVDVPIFSLKEEEKGFPKSIKELFKQFAQADGFIISSPEHNGLPTAFLKNIIDWISRIDQKFFGDKPVLLLSTSPGRNGGASNLRVLEQLLPIWGGNPTGTFALGSFNHSFDQNTMEVSDAEQATKLDRAVKNFLELLHS
ncbi:MAG: NAD(P)H-dependent oxidoreductase [Bacteroidota bacterium]